VTGYRHFLNTKKLHEWSN